MRFWFMGLHTVLECTGHYLTEPTSQMHIAAGAKKVVISAPSKDSIPMFVFGVKHKKYAGAAIVPNASCTTNYLAPVVKVLNDKWGIKRGLMTTVHEATASQKTDEPFSKLDAALRAQLRPWVFAHVRQRRIPVVLATHDEQDVAGPKRVLHLRATEESPHHV